MSKIFIEESTLSAIGNSIRAKTGRTSKIPPLNMPAEIVSIQAGSSSALVSANDATFYDYDGTVVASYSFEEVQALTSLPDGPTHDGLTFQGWNLSLGTIKTMYRAVNVGAIYTTNDGKTRIYITLGKGRTSPLLGCCPNGTVIVDWGDGTTPDTLTGTSTSTIKYTPTHSYASPGNYIISLTVNGTCGFLGDSTFDDCCHLLRYSTSKDTRNIYYQNAITKIEFGVGVTSIGSYTFMGCSSLTSLTIPDSVTSIGPYAFNNCYSLTSLTIPDGATSIGGYTFNSCSSLTTLTIPNSVTSIESYAFSGCSSLTSLTIPDSVTSIGPYAFNNCYSLTSPTIPVGVTDIGHYVFQNCYSLTSLTIPNSVTSIESNAFNCCYSLTSLTIPVGVTDIGLNVFKNCYSLTSLTIPVGVTSIKSYTFSDCSSLISLTIPDGVTRIENYAFYDCFSLTSLTIPDGVTSIGSGAFAKCYGMAEYHLKSATPPTLSSTSAFNSIPDDCIIYVPQGSLEAYQTATNWATYASHMQEETI